MYAKTRELDDPLGGPIVDVVLRALRAAQAEKVDGNPLVVITYCMGGTIFYDIMSHFAPDLVVDAWVSVGSHVSQYENLKLFKASNTSVGKRKKVKVPKGIKYWLNVYDPSDFFAFPAKPVFDRVEDCKLDRRGTLVAHTTYFERTDFYEAVRARLPGMLARGSAKT
jgi:hypothetical protein